MAFLQQSGMGWGGAGDATTYIAVKAGIHNAKMLLGMTFLHLSGQIPPTVGGAGWGEGGSNHVHSP